MQESKTSFLTWGQDIFVDSITTFAFSVYLPDNAFSIVLTDPFGQQVPLNGVKVQKIFTWKQF
jgi:hypothetical protein